MDVSTLLSELKQELERIEHAILALEKLAAGSGKRRGRPPAWLSKAHASHVENSEVVEVERTTHPRVVTAGQ